MFLSKTIFLFSCFYVYLLSKYSLMEIPDHIVDELCTKLREVLQTLESYSDSQQQRQEISDMYRKIHPNSPESLIWAKTELMLSLLNRP